jgi:hypothetical protein
MIDKWGLDPGAQLVEQTSCFLLSSDGKQRHLAAPMSITNHAPHQATADTLVILRYQAAGFAPDHAGEILQFSGSHFCNNPDHPHGLSGSPGHEHSLRLIEPPIVGLTDKLRQLCDAALPLSESCARDPWLALQKPDPQIQIPRAFSHAQRRVQIGDSG